MRIAVIGAGASGATATKACIEEGFDVVVYEKTDFTGGLWRYHDDDVNGIASVAKSTIINSSKEMSAFSDFPPPEDFPNYMHNTKMVRYFELYGETFNFNSFVKFRHEIVNCELNNDNKWILTIRSDGKTFHETFDGVMVCTGHHVTPLVPSFPGQELFKGQIMHTHSYKKPEKFDNKTVVVIGIGNSGGDAVVELSMVAKKVFLSTRRGTWVVHRVGPNGFPFDATFLTRFWNTLMSLTPYNILCSTAEWYMNTRFNHNNYQLKPDHRIFAQHIFVNDALPNRILSGTVIVKGDIKQFTENGVIFDDGKEVHCDYVLLATGYRVEFPFISKQLISAENNSVDLYKYMFSPNLPKSLAFIALAQPIGALFPIAEIQSRFYALIMANKLQLPSKEVMINEIERKRNEMRNRYYGGERHTVQVDWIPFMDEIATLLHVKPNLWKYFITDPVLWMHLYFGPCVPYQYRLQGPHKWSDARKTILSVSKRIDAPLKTKHRNATEKSYEKHLRSLIGFAFIALFILLISVWF